MGIDDSAPGDAASPYDANFRWQRVGKIAPKRTDDLKPGAASVIGMTLNLVYGFTLDADERYPGQSTWIIDQRKHPELFAGVENPPDGWWPEEDIEFEEK